MHSVRVGTASWTDKTLIKSGTFYPREVTNPEGRLRFYATHFDTVEVDSTYYALPSERNAMLWAERTPPGFVFHIKAYSMLTGHPTLVKTIPKALRDDLPKPTLHKAHEKIFPKGLVDAAFDMFRTALAPLKEAGKLGCVLFQFPPWFVPSSKAYQWMEMVRDRFPSDNLAVEFRNARWVTFPERERSLRFLEDHGMAYVIVDAPWIKGWQGPVAVTAPVAYIRLHGRNRENWFKKGVETVERYRYLYGDEELTDWADKAKKTSTKGDRTFVIFNNCFEDYGIRNAKVFRGLLKLK
jgi:uncharacterized protein YecE (DUF72 family)